MAVAAIVAIAGLQPGVQKEQPAVSETEEAATPAG
jgi:hypothetical protein